MASLNTIKSWFKTGLRPTSAQFSAAWDSYFHKDDTIPVNKIENLDNRFGDKIDKEVFQFHERNNEAHNELFTGLRNEFIGLSTANFKGLAQAATVPAAPTAEKPLFYQATAGVAYANFKDAANAAVSIPLKVGDKYVVNPRLLSVGNVWSGVWELVDGVDPIDFVQKEDYVYAGTFDSLALALAGVPISKRKVGLTVGIKMAEGIVEFWWKSRTADIGLVEKKNDNLNITMETTGNAITLDYTHFTEAGYINGAGNPEQLATFKHTPLRSIPTGANFLQINVAGTASFAFYDANDMFIAITGTAVGADVIDFRKALDPKWKKFKASVHIKFLPGGADFSTNPAYIKSLPSNKVEVEIPSLNVVPSNISGATLVGGGYIYDNINRITSFPNSGYIDGSGVVKALGSYRYSDLTPIPTGKDAVKVSFASVFTLAFYDAVGTFIETLGHLGSDVYDYDIPVPHGAKSVIYMMPTTEAPGYLYFGTIENKYSLDWLYTPSAPGPTTPNKWEGKKIIWYGTSIPAGYPKQATPNIWSYANKTAINLGAKINNKSVPNGVIRSAKADGGSMGGRDLLSFTNLASAINYQNSMLDLIGTINEPDLFVFDYSVNDYDADKSDMDAYSSFNMTSEDTTKFIGALNFTLKKLYTKKKRARVAIITHYSDDSISSGVPSWANANRCIEKVAAYWGIPILKLHERTGWVNKNGVNILLEMNPDAIHPASMATTHGVDLIADITTAFLKSL